METIDETILNDDNDDDLDYDLDPKEENALLQEETEFLEQEYEEDVLDINVDYDQMDVTDDKSDSVSLVASKSEKRIGRNTDADLNRTGPGKIEQNNKFRNLSRLRRKGPLKNPGNKIKSKTVLINPRFKGPVHVNGRPLAWEKSAVVGQLPTNQQYVQPWAPASMPNQIVHPVNNYNPAIFVPNNTYTYVQQPQQQILQPPPFAQPQVFVNPLPVMNHAPLMNQQNLMPPQPPIQMNPFNNAFPPPQLETIQQVHEQPKLPVHQRLGIPMNSFNPPDGNQVQYNNNQAFNNHTAFEAQEPHNFNQSSYNQQMPNTNQSDDQNNYGYKRFDNVRTQSFHKKQHKKFFGNHKVNNRVLLSPSKSSFRAEIQEESAEETESINCAITEKSSSSNIVVVPEDEDEETRQYRMKIEEQKKKREEVLRKKEENRLKSLSNANPETPPSPPAVQIARNNPARNFKHKKPNYQQRPKPNFQFAKPQVNSNNIVITGNDDRFNSRSVTKVNSYGASYKSPTLRIVTAKTISCDQIDHSNAEPFERERVDSESLSSFLSNRVVSAQENLMRTNIVVVRNLATATTEPKLMKLCGGIGSVQKLQMETNERQATIHFDSVASAHKFFNKYRRYMIDLSMIQVDLVPCEGSS